MCFKILCFKKRLPECAGWETGFNRTGYYAVRIVSGEVGTACRNCLGVFDGSSWIWFASFPVPSCGCCFI